MGKFQVGDRVRLIEDNGSGKFGEKGDVGVFDIIGDDGFVRFETGKQAGDYWYVSEDRLELHYQAGDLVRALDSAGGQFTAGLIYETDRLSGSFLHVLRDDSGGSNGWDVSYFEPAHRPVPVPALEPDAATAEVWDHDPRSVTETTVKVSADLSPAHAEVDSLLAKLRELEALANKLGVKLGYAARSAA